MHATGLTRLGLLALLLTGCPRPVTPPATRPPARDASPIAAARDEAVARALAGKGIRARVTVAETLDLDGDGREDAVYRGEPVAGCVVARRQAEGWRVDVLAAPGDAGKLEKGTTVRTTCSPVIRLLKGPLLAAFVTLGGDADGGQWVMGILAVYRFAAGRDPEVAYRESIGTHGSWTFRPVSADAVELVLTRESSALIPLKVMHKLIRRNAAGTWSPVSCWGERTVDVGEAPPCRITVPAGRTLRPVEAAKVGPSAEAGAALALYPGRAPTTPGDPQSWCVALPEETGWVELPAAVTMRCPGGTPPRVLDPEAVYRVPVAGRPFRGPRHARVTVAVFGDLECPWCYRTAPLFEELLEKYPKDVKVVWFDFPLRFHKHALPAAIAAHEVFLQKGSAAFFAYHDKVLDNHKRLTAANLVAWAKEVGADPAKVSLAIQNGTHEQAVTEAMKAGQRIGVKGTPTFLINGRLYPGSRHLADVSRVIDAEIARTKAVIRGGVPLASYYDHLQKSALPEARYLPPGTVLPTPPKQELDPEAIYKVPVDLARDPWTGARTPLVTLVVWSDFQCPYCKWFACVLKEVLAAYPDDVRLVYKHNPMSFHRQAMPAAEAAMAAHARKGNAGFFAMHDRLFPMDRCVKPMPNIRAWIEALPEPGPQLDAPGLASHARAIGLSPTRFKADLARHTFRRHIRATQALAYQLGTRGVPAVFVNGRYHRGAQPLPRLKEIIDAEIVRAKKLLSERRIQRARLYDALTANGATAPVYLPAPAAPRP